MHMHQSNMISIIAHHFPKRFPVILLLMLVSGILEGFGIGIIIPIFEFFFEGRDYSKASEISHVFFGILEKINLPINLKTLFGFSVFIFGLKSILKYLELFLMEQLIRYFTIDYSKQIFKRLINLEWAIFQKEKIGAYQNLLIEDMNKALSSIRSMVLLSSDGLLITFYILLSFFVSWQLTTFVLLFLTINGLLLYLFIRKGKAYGNIFRQYDFNYLSTLTESFNLIKWIKSAGYSDHTTQHFNHSLSQKADYQFKIKCFQSILPAFFIFFSIFSLAIISFFGLVLFKLSFPSLLLLLTIFYRILPKFQHLQHQYQSLLLSLPSFTHLHQFLADSTDQCELFGTIEYQSLQHNISFSNVSFTYTKNQESCLSKLSFIINKHSFTALVGPSGCGKTTLVDCLTGLLKPQSGNIFIDDLPLADYDINSFRQGIGVVSQDILLLHDTIRVNLGWDKHYSDDQIKYACDLAHATHFIQQLPQGFDTIIGERGVKLSGGQRQRLALARALIRDPDILIFDEATSALDAESEQFIQNTIHSFKGKKTLIIISHRLASVKQADQILVMDHGSLIETGTWDTLSKSEGLFQKFKELQILN